VPARPPRPRRAPARRARAGWVGEHERDEFVQRARREGLRSRAAYKLEEIAERDHLLRPGMCVVDLGAAPGGWSQVAARRVGRAGRVVALDRRPMDPIPGVEQLTGDCTDPEVLARLGACLGGRPVDLVMSDMAPDISGVGPTDAARAAELIRTAIGFAGQVLRPGGVLLVKLFQGTDAGELRRELGASFAAVAVRKPKASRARSAEIYLLARGFTGSVSRL